MQRDGTASSAELMAARAKSYHAMQIRDKIAAKEESAGRDEHGAGSRERALNTAPYEGFRNPSRRNNGRNGRNRRGNGTRNTNSPARGNTVTAVTRRGTRTATCRRRATQLLVDWKVHANECTATVQAEEDDGVIAMTERTATADAIAAGNPLSTAGTTAPFATRTREVTTRTVLMLHRSVPNENADLENFQLVIGGGAERPPSNDETYEYATNKKVQGEHIAFRAMTEIGTGTTPGDTAVFIYTAASNHAVPAESKPCQHVVKNIDCCMRVRGHCGPTMARTKCTFVFGVQNDRGELVQVHLKVLIVPKREASVLSVGALHEKGVNLDLIANPPVLRNGNSAFPVSTECPRMFVLRILLNRQDKSRDNILSHTAVDTDSCHRRMDPCPPRALKQLTEELTTGANASMTALEPESRV